MYIILQKKKKKRGFESLGKSSTKLDYPKELLFDESDSKTTEDKKQTEKEEDDNDNDDDDEDGDGDEENDEIEPKEEEEEEKEKKKEKEKGGNNAKNKTKRKKKEKVIDKLCQWLCNLKAIAFIHNDIIDVNRYLHQYRPKLIYVSIDSLRCGNDRSGSTDYEEDNIPFPVLASLVSISSGVHCNMPSLEQCAENSSDLLISDTEITYTNIQALQIFSSYSAIPLKAVRSLLKHVQFLGLDYDCHELATLQEFQRVLLHEANLLHLSLTGWAGELVVPKSVYSLVIQRWFNKFATLTFEGDQLDNNNDDDNEEKQNEKEKEKEKEKEEKEEKSEDLVSHGKQRDDDDDSDNDNDNDESGCHQDQLAHHTNQLNSQSIYSYKTSATQHDIASRRRRRHRRRCCHQDDVNAQYPTSLDDDAVEMDHPHCSIANEEEQKNANTTAQIGEIKMLLNFYCAKDMWLINQSQKSFLLRVKMLTTLHVLHFVMMKEDLMNKVYLNLSRYFFFFHFGYVY
ncbi:hypothetical protein RFI_29947 [Reticulomyxa filosa]|uniref:Uncharacterized protein n=1 Tax=Reticulomyxa filosa TaxID=46433 RepID=X6M0R0_RETFI|nr:hypothetical protein RFI_29947 [Reticulomyxa filosa]|eukprot:ETO07444.1 hypothetical protein RFI_29947 [Reticulomyxa filosa]